MEKLKEYLKSILFALVLSFGIRVAIAEPYYIIPSGSMRPTIMDNDHVMGNKFIYRFTDPRPGDVVVFTPPAAAHTDAPRFVKRLIAVEGDWVEVKDGAVYRNGKPLSEPYVMATPDYSLPLFRVPEGQMFVLGDNRRNSHDSHIWGFLPKKNVIAKALFCYWPPSRMGLVE